MVNYFAVGCDRTPNSFIENKFKIIDTFHKSDRSSLLKFNPVDTFESSSKNDLFSPLKFCMTSRNEIPDMLCGRRGFSRIHSYETLPKNMLTNRLATNTNTESTVLEKYKDSHIEDHQRVSHSLLDQHKIPSSVAENFESKFNKFRTEST